MLVKQGSRKARSSGVEADWAEVIRTGPEGVAAWNARTRTERQLTRLGHGDYARCDLAGIDFTGQSILKFRARGADLSGANLGGGSFIGGDFREADLSFAQMARFCGRDGDFRGAKFVGADLTSGRLARAKFVDADLTRADLTGADVVGADFTGADLTGAILAELVFDQTTTWPAGFVVPAPAGGSFGARGSSGAGVNIDGFLARMHQSFNANRMCRTLEMLRTGRNQLFAEVEETRVSGIVRSQREPDLVYSCVLAEDGTYSCCTPDLKLCLGLRGEPCKHLLVLLIGLARAGKLEATTADRWVAAARGKNHAWSETLQDHLANTLLKYKGAEAGEIDWRPTETIPEDFYAM